MSAEIVEKGRKGKMPTWGGKHLRLVATIAAAVSGLLIYGFFHNRYSWDEEVQLSDGSVIVVHRVTQFSKTLMPAGGPGAAVLKDASIQIRDSESPQPALWKMRLYPIHIDKNPETKQWVILADLTGVGFSQVTICDVWNRQGRPPYPVVAFSYKDDRWQQVPVPEYLAAERINLIPMVPRHDVPLVALGHKEAWLSTMGYRWPAVLSKEVLQRGASLPKFCVKYLDTARKK